MRILIKTPTWLGTSLLRTACVLLFTLTAVAFSPGSARAQAGMSAEQLERFKLRVSDGKRLFEMGKYRASIEQFEAARDIFDHPRLIFNIAQSYRAMGACERAEDNFEQYLALPKLDDKMRARATRLLADVEDSCVEEGMLQIVCTPENITLNVTPIHPDATRGKTQRVDCPLTSSFPVGLYEITAHIDGFKPTVQQVRVRHNETQNIRLTLESDSRFLDPQTEEILIYSTLGVGAATVVAGFISDYTAVSRLDALRQAREQNNTSQVAKLRDEADSASTRSAILYGVGGVMLAAGVTWKIIDMNTHTEAPAPASASNPHSDRASAGAEFSVEIGLNQISTRLNW